MTPGRTAEEDRERSRPSLLSGWLRIWLAVVLGVTAFMVANSLYLTLVRIADWADLAPFALGEEHLPTIYQVMLLGHTGVGFALAALTLVFVVAHLPRVWRRLRRNVALSGALAVTLAVLVVASGLFILTEAASRANAWAWWVHVLGAGALIAAYLMHRAAGTVKFSGSFAVRFAASSAGIALVGFLVHGLSGGTNASPASSVLAEPATEPNPRSGGSPPEPARGVQPGPGTGGPPIPALPSVDSDFFPSPASVASGSLLARGFLTASGWGPDVETVRREVEEQGFARSIIGAGACVTCHPDVSAQWAASAHRFSSFNNPFYVASIDELRSSERTNPWIARHLEVAGKEELKAGVVKSRWCASCHDPALLFTGMMDAEIDRGSVEAQAGLTCLACHTVHSVKDLTGNGNYQLAEMESPYLFSKSPPGSALRQLHDWTLKARPAPHRRALLKPFFREAEFCASCHKVSLDEPVNEYRWLRGQNEFDAWHDSGVAGNAARTFYLPGSVRGCRDCHMPPEPASLGDRAADRDGMVRSHRFLAANTALPFVRGDTAMLRLTEKYLRTGKMRVDLFGVRRGEEDAEGVSLGLGSSAELPAGSTATLEVVVRNLGVGHTFPGGTNDSNEAWLEVVVADSTGTRLAESGTIRGDGRVDSLAHFFRIVAVDSLGERISRRNPQDIRAVVYSNLVGPGSARLAHYRLTVPEELVGTDVLVTVRLLWRKFDRDFTEFAHAANPSGFVDRPFPPELPVTEIAADTVRFAVTGEGARAETVDARTTPGTGAVGLPGSAAPWERFNDYGIALLLEGDTRRASTIFSEVERLAPDRVDGATNLARSALAAGELEAAYDALERAEELDPGNARVAWVWGGALQEDGEYVGAAAAYRRVIEDFPRDRASWRELGRSLYLGGEFEEALEAFDEVLAIDPEDRVAHYHRMLSLRALGREAEATLAQAAYERYAIDESALEITTAFRSRDRGSNNMAQAIRTHELAVRRR
ncbi:MAG: tetratricopeptide repeat protein [Gemmatimonadetes bacterium]|nr:tetratricopeptide repeat protein [Gemmatimonadota bacterium]